MEYLFVSISGARKSVLGLSLEYLQEEVKERARKESKDAERNGAERKVSKNLKNPNWRNICDAWLSKRRHRGVTPLGIFHPSLKTRPFSSILGSQTDLSLLLSEQKAVELFGYIVLADRKRIEIRGVVGRKHRFNLKGKAFLSHTDDGRILAYSRPHKKVPGESIHYFLGNFHKRAGHRYNIVWKKLLSKVPLADRGLREVLHLTSPFPGEVVISTGFEIYLVRKGKVEEFDKPEKYEGWFMGKVVQVGGLLIGTMKWYDIMIWDIRTLQLIATFGLGRDGKREEIPVLCAAAQGQKLVLGTDKDLHILDFSKTEIEGKFVPPGSGYIHTITKPDGTFLSMKRVERKSTRANEVLFLDDRRILSRNISTLTLYDHQLNELMKIEAEVGNSFVLDGLGVLGYPPRLGVFVTDKSVMIADLDKKQVFSHLHNSKIPDPYRWSDPLIRNPKMFSLKLFPWDTERFGQDLLPLLDAVPKDVGKEILKFIAQ